MLDCYNSDVNNCNGSCNSEHPLCPIAMYVKGRLNFKPTVRQMMAFVYFLENPMLAIDCLIYLKPFMFDRLDNFDEKEKYVLVDVDNTLWNFDTPWYKEICNLYGKIDYPWKSWDYVENTIGVNNLLRSAGLVYDKQLDFKPFNTSKELLDVLHSKGYKIIIASHRHISYRNVLEKWLKANNLYYDELYVGSNKLQFIFSRRVTLVVDDSPLTLLKALNSGIKCLSLSYLYNQHLLEYNRRGLKLVSSPLELLNEVKLLNIKRV